MSPIWIVKWVWNGLPGRPGLREVTIKLHRGRLMRKLNARTLPDLVRMVDLLNDCVSLRAENTGDGNSRHLR
ncbi:LuxR C-terminal-related transcriptional regulator [Rhizobium sp. BK176]|uniref:LuxR C-terminal-related transcriptional regulator n=1 Tax=Rhizobium sp. BK176 TaxID=2587071 RepID=UPI003864034E